MEPDLGINVLVLNLRFSHHHAALMGSSSYFLNRLSLLGRGSLVHLSFSSGRSSHLDLLIDVLLVGRVGILVDGLSHMNSLMVGLVDLRLHDVGAWHLHLLVPHLLPHLSASSPLGDAEFAEDTCQNGSSDEHSPPEHVVVDFPLASSLLSLFFSQISIVLIILIIEILPL